MVRGGYCQPPLCCMAPARHAESNRPSGPVTSQCKRLHSLSRPTPPEHRLRPTDRRDVCVRESVSLSDPDSSSFPLFSVHSSGTASGIFCWISEKEDRVVCLCVWEGWWKGGERSVFVVVGGPICAAACDRWRDSRWTLHRFYFIDENMKHLLHFSLIWCYFFIFFLAANQTASCLTDFSASLIWVNYTEMSLICAGDNWIVAAANAQLAVWKGEIKLQFFKSIVPPTAAKVEGWRDVASCTWSLKIHSEAWANAHVFMPEPYVNVSRACSLKVLQRLCREV